MTAKERIVSEYEKALRVAMGTEPDPSAEFLRATRLTPTEEIVRASVERFAASLTEEAAANMDPAEFRATLGALFVHFTSGDDDGPAAGGAPLN